MTIIPDKHTFTIWQGATFFEVLTLYETLDTSTPRDFFTSSSITGVTVQTYLNNPTATLSTGVGVTATFTSGQTYYISSNYIDATKGIYFTPATTITLNNSSATVELKPNANNSISGVTTGTGSATITNRTAAYSAEMIIRDKPQGTQRIKLATADGSPSTGCSITFSDSPVTKGRIVLEITASATAALTWKTGVYDLTITKTSTGVTDALLYGGIKVNGV